MRHVRTAIATAIALLVLVRVPISDGGFACLSNPCVHGVCLDDLNTTYSCYCIDGYTGVQCQTNWDECWSNPCQNGGLCLDGIAAFNCTCPPGFIGDLCEENLNECLSNPCLNNGTCMDAANGYFCNCLPGYSGVHCDLDIAVCNLTNETRCSNGGMCIEGPGVTFSCRCPDGWTGFLCELEVDECMSHPCQNGAVCVDLHADYECACLFGYAGRNCEEVVLICDDNPCRNDALCLMEDDRPVCYCVPDYHGERCQFQYDECKLSNNRCLNGGTCIDGVDGFTCSCPPRLTGIFCECLILEIKGGIYLDCSYTTPTTTTTNATLITETIPVTMSTVTTLSTITTWTPETTETTTEMTPEVPKTDTTSTTEEVTVTSTTPPTTITTVTTTDSTTITSTTEELSTSTTQESTTTEFIQSTTEESTIESETTTSQTEVTSTIRTTDISTLTTETTLTTNEETPTSTTEMETTSTEVVTTTTEPSTSISSSTISSTSTEKTSTSTSISSSTEAETESTITTTPMSETTTPEEATTSSLTTETSTTPTTTLIATEAETTSEEPSTTMITSTTMNMTEVSSTTTIEVTDFPIVTDFLTTSTETTTLGDLSTFSSTTTEVGTTFTTEIPFDCSKNDQQCENGGTCVFREGFRCVCPYDFAGERCEDVLGVRTAAFNGNSYLLHQVHTKSRLQVDFKARTTSANGLLFYTNIEDTYMALYMEQGHLKFKFSCGFQTMLLSELNKPVNNGNEMRISALLTFSEDLRTCNASIKLNNTLSMSGAQTAKFDNFIKSKSWLYLGGLNEKANPVAKLPGFIGCMSELSVLGKPLQIFKDAEDGFGITECSSLACLSNPCRNGGTCSAITGGKYPAKDAYFCKCRNGFVGKQCDRSVCENNPCQFGGTCLPFTGSGYICLCPYGKHGHFCENDLKISKAYYSSSVQGYASYTSYPVPKSSYKYMQVKFRITPSSINQISLLMFMGQQSPHDFYSDHVAVSFVKGYIMLTWNLGAGPRRIFTTKPIPADKASYEIQVGQLGRRAWLHVEHLGNVTGRSKGSLSQLDVEPIIYFGGYKSKDYEGLPHDLPLHSGFAGCIFDMEFKIGDVTISLGSSRAMGRAVGQCGTTECYEGVCQNDGACLYHGGTFTCMCQDGHYGPLCSSRTNLCDRNRCAIQENCVPMIASYECDCPLGQKGKLCDQDETLSDISFTGARSYVTLSPRHFEPNKLNFDLELRPLQDGLVAFIGNEQSFFSLTLLSGLLELRIMPRRQRSSSHEVIITRSNKMLRLGQWHQVKIQVYGRKIYLFVDNIVNTGSMQPGDVLDLSNEEIYLGGLPDLSELPQEATCEFPTWFGGCLRKLFIDTNHISLNEDTILTAQNIVDCDGTPCGGDFCSNGGTCWLDPNLKPHCNCPEPYYGEKCQLVYDCTEHKCKNQGYCLEGRCVCKVGYVGTLCETGLTIRSPKFVGRSYLYVNAPADVQPPQMETSTSSSNKKRDSFSESTPRNISILFRTASDGLLLFAHDRSKLHGFTIGIQNGKLLLSDETQSMELLSGPMLDDGEQHLVTLEFRPFRLQIDAQDYDVSRFNKVEFDEFYLGGVPGNVTMNTLDSDAEYFHGCVERISTGSWREDVRIQDFNALDGENIEDCSNNYNY